MRNYFFLLMLLISSTATCQMRSIASDVSNPLDKKYETFMVIDESNGYVLSQQPTAFDAGASMPLVYFTLPLVNPSVVPGGNPRLFEIHAFDPQNEYDWVLQDNEQEKDIFFGRSRFIGDGLTVKWHIHVDGRLVFLQNAATGNFLQMDQNGDCSPVSDRNEATRLKLVHVFE